MSVNVKFRVGIKKNINTSFNIENKEPIRTIFRINAGTAAFSSILGSPYDNTALASALDLKADKTAVAGQIETVTDLINSTSETLDNKIDSVQSSLAGDISTLAQTVESYNTATNLRIDETNTTVADNFTTLNGKIEINTQAISDLAQTVADNYTAVNNRIDGVVTSFDGDISNLENAIQNEAEARANADTTLQGNINTLSNTVTSNYNTLDTKIDNTKTAVDSDISDLSDTVSANYTDLNGQISDLSGTVESYNTSTNGRIDTLSQTVSTNDTAINNKVDGINTTLTNSINSLSDTVTSNYNALDARITANTGNIATNAGNITTINSKIPNQASSSNQLADKDFVNSSIATNTANFIGTFNSVAELEAYSGTLTNNDYAFVATTDTVGNTLYDRYKYNADTQEWLFEYELNNSSFTAQQWASINSGITSGDVTLIGTALQPNDNISELINDTGYITSASLPTVNNGTLDIQVNGTSIGTFTANQSGNTTANIVVPDSATWGNITGTLSDQTDLQTALDSKLQNTARGSKSLNILGNVTNYACSISIGYYSYVPSSDAIAIGYNTQAKSQNSMAIGGDGTTVGTGSNYSIALGIGASVDNSKTRAIQIGEGTNSNRQTLQIGFGTNYNYTLLDGTTGLIPDARISTNIARTSAIPDVSNFVTNTSLATTLTDYALSTDIPTVNNGTLTIQKNGTTIGTFTANQSTNSTINIEADTVLTDDTTVNKNSDDELQTIGVIDDNVQNAYNFTVVGSPKITEDGIASGFSNSNYITNNLPALGSQPFKIVTKVNTGEAGTNRYICKLGTSAYKSVLLIDKNNNLAFWTVVNDGNNTDVTPLYHNIPANTDLFVKVEWDGNYYWVSISYDGKTWLDSTKRASTYPLVTYNQSGIYIGYLGALTGAYASGSIDLKQFSITVDGVEVYKAWQPPAIKYWTGTKAQYEAIVTKDSTTLYNITDDTDTTLTLLELLFPIGAVYFGTMATCPLQTLGVGTWQALPQDKVIQIAGTRGAVGTTINESLPAFSFNGINIAQNWANNGNIMTQAHGYTTKKYTDSIYQDNAPVQQDAYLLNGWRRIA